MFITDNMHKMVLTKRRKDGEVWLDDCNEVFLMLRDGQTYYHFVVNAAGQRYDAQGKDPSWNGNWQGAARRFPDRWSAEFLLPVNMLGKELQPGEDLMIKLNLCRRNAVQGRYSQWSRTYGSSHEPGFFGQGIVLRK